MNSLRPEVHIAQQSRRDKLRIQQDIYGNNFPNLESESELCSEMINFSSNPQHYLSDWVANYHQELHSSSDMNAAPSLYQNALQELVTSSNNARSFRHNPQALSLSLSSVPSPRLHQTQIADTDFQDSPNQSMSTVRPFTHRNPGPLGPFTGYATILRSSRFLRPAQQLLEDLCCIAAPPTDVPISHHIFEDPRVSPDHATSEAPGGASDACPPPPPPENLHRKANLLFMQDEVCKRYKQYHQQMQLVVSSFESVAGLNAATPYVSLALKMIAKHFRCLKNAIADQLKSIKNALRDEFSSPSAGTSGNKGDASASVLKFFDQSFQKQKGVDNLGILEGQHIWRPQRGLPERAVSILRAWLFDHFLHPYPTDTDKHMLATQTGLTRNQVSNWFINARVRVWKPMVEEIHMLETKGSENAGKTSNGKTALEGCEQPDDGSQSLNRLRMRAVPDKQVGCSSLGPPGQEADRSKANLWNQEKRSRIEYHVPGSVDGSLMGFVPSHHRSGGDMGGIGSVSLTLGLTQSPEGGQRPPMQQERHLRHYGGQIIRDLVG